MAQLAQYKVNQFAKDLNLKSKDVIDILESKKMAVKSQSTLDEAQFDVLFEALTSSNQITGIEDYIDGITYIPSAIKADVAKKAEAEKETNNENKADEQAKKAEPAAVVAPAQNTDKKEQKAEIPAKEAPKAEAKAEAKIAVAQPEESKKAASVEKTAIKTDVDNKVKKEFKKEQSSPEAKKPEFSAPKANAEPRRDDRARPQASATNPAFERRQGAYTDNRVNQNQNGYQNRNNFGAGAQRPAQQGQQRPAQQGQQFGRPQGNAPQQSWQQRGQQGQQGGQFGERNNRFENPFGQKNQAPRKDMGRPNNQFRDKDSEGGNVHGGLKETFKPQIEARPQTQKGDAVTKQKGAVKVVDLRAGNVDLSKYDERLDNFVPDIMGDVRGGNQRVKKQAPGNNRPMKNGKNNKNQKGSSQPVTKAPTSVTLPEEIMVSDLASRLKVTAAEVVKRLMLLGMMVTVNQTVDYDTAAIVADEMGIAATKEVVVTIEERLFEEEEDSEENLAPRAPVVCVMGHVDHGKTSILDAIRHTSVTRGEAGGITQHIGAYRVRINDQDITFLDTPGHEAFTAMRARGAQATDIAVLVVAADDGIMPQTVEAINHAKAAGIDIIVAINKMDKPTANPDNVMQELTKYDLVPEEWGGDVICVPVSALTGFGIENLLENILLVAEVKELKANPKRRAKGIVIEAKLDKGRGPVATILVQGGTLHSGDIVIAGTAVGRVRAMTDHNGRTLKEAGPSVPVEIIGLDEVPSSGDEFNAVEDERMARTLADQRRAKAKEEVFKANARANLNDLFAQISEGVKELNVIVKADVGGSAEAVKQSLEKISNEEVRVRVIHAAAGGIRENDVMLAAASNAIIVGFNVRPDKAALDSAERQNVDIRTYRVIYDCINEITDAMKGMLAPKFKETLLGHAEVRQTIHVPNVGTIAGSYIQDGKITRASMIRIVRDGVVIFEDKISSLKRFKDDVREVAQGYECGVGLERFNDIKIGDVLEAFIMEEIAR